MGKSICSYTSLGNNTPRDIDKKFREIHKYLCYYQTSIPSQNGNSGKFLTTDGISLSWGNISSGSGLFPVTGTGTATGAVTGDLAGNTLTISGGNVGIGATPTADQLLVVNDGSNDLFYIRPTIHKTYIRQAGTGGGESKISFQNDVATNSLYFDLSSDDGGSNNVDIFGDAVANTVTITAGAGVALSAPASTTASILANGTISFYLDEVGNNLKVAVQYSDGTTKTATVALA